MNKAETITFTVEQIAAWKQFERVRSSGRFNMFDPRAELATHLSHDAYLFCMENYSDLKVQAMSTAIAAQKGGV